MDDSVVRRMTTLGWRTAGAAADLAESVPIAGGMVRSARARTHDVIDASVAGALGLTRATLTMIVREVLDVLATDVDLTALVVDNVDIDAIVASVDLDRAIERVDLDKAVARVDLDAAVGRVDLDRVVDGVDLDRAVARVDLMGAIGRVDLDQVVAGVDLDAAVERVDVEAIIRRVDLIGLANEIIDGVDLTSIIRDASTSVTADVMTDVRSSGERADDAVADIIGRVLGRRPAAGSDG